MSAPNCLRILVWPDPFMMAKWLAELLGILYIRRLAQSGLSCFETLGQAVISPRQGDVLGRAFLGQGFEHTKPRAPCQS